MNTARIVATALAAAALATVGGIAQAAPAEAPAPAACPADVIAYALGTAAEPTTGTTPAGPGAQAISVSIPDLPETRAARIAYACAAYAQP